MSDKNLIPGAAILGRGFNILGAYNTDSLMQKIYNYEHAEDRTYTVQETGIGYDVPDNMSVIARYTTSTRHGLYDSRESFQEEFSTQAGVSGSYGAFSGEFNLAFSSQTESEQAAYYGYYRTNVEGWVLALDHYSTDWLDASFLDDPGVKTLPDSFTPENQRKFFEFFRKYGTHFVRQVTVGGSLDYYFSIHSDYQVDKKSLEADMSFEYDGAIAKAKAEGSVEWKKTTDRWTENREVSIVARGGHADSLSSIGQPKDGDSFHDVYENWTKSVYKQPTSLDFQLMPIHGVFSGQKQQAVEQALDAYLSRNIYCIAAWDDTNISVNNNNLQPIVDGSPVHRDSRVTTDHLYVARIELALLDPHSYQPLLNKLYYQKAYSYDGFNAIFNQIMADIKSLQKQQYAVALTCSQMQAWAPPAAFLNWMNSIGANMVEWHNRSKNSYANDAYVQYVCIGRTGLRHGSALEAYTDKCELRSGARLGKTVSGTALLYGDTNIVIHGRDAFKSFASAFGNL